MNKFLQKFLLSPRLRDAKKISVVAVALCIAFVGFAQGKINGYFRVTNAETGKYVEVTGPFSADPTQTKEAAQYKAGTVIYVNAEQPATGEMVYKVTSLRSQGIEVVGDYINDYYETLQDIIFTEQGFDSSNEALWNLVRGGFKYGYTSIGRALIQTMIYIVAERLDTEGFSDKEKQELANFADRFNNEVAQYIDLSIRLEPVDGAENTFRLYYETPTLDVVSNWYLKPENQEIFEKGFNAMRQYLNGKTGFTGEGLDPAEIEEMKSWGYDPTEKHKNFVDGYLLSVPYEEIFADPELLFNWLKLNVIKFTDVNRCPAIDLHGIYLPNFAKEMQNHRITKQIIEYLPKVQPNQKIYLCDGKNGVTGHFDFTSEEGANSLKRYAQWVMLPVDNKDEKMLLKGGASYYGNYYWDGYYDFPVTAADAATTTLNLLSVELEDTDKHDFDFNGYTFVELIPQEGEVALQTPIVVRSSEAETQLNVADGVTVIKPLGKSIGVSDEVADKQRAPRRVDAAEAAVNEHFRGNLLSFSYTLEGLKNYLDIDATEDNVLVYYGVQSVDELAGTYIAFGFGEELIEKTIAPNHVLYVTNSSPKEERVLIYYDEPVEVVVKADDKTYEEDGSITGTEEKPLRVAQAFDGANPNVFENIVSFDMELTYGKDFTVTVSIPEGVDDTDWTTPAYPDDLAKSYFEILGGEESPVYMEYWNTFGGTELESMADDVVDGFYLSDHLAVDETAVLHTPEAMEDENGDIVYAYNLTFDAPCSGIYEITVEPCEGSPVKFTSGVNSEGKLVRKVKIYPNLYGEFGKNHDVKGFQINEVEWVKYEYRNGYAVILPDGTDLTDCEASIPGTYFASSLSVDYGDGVQKEAKIRRRAGENGASDNYFIKLDDLTNNNNTSTPITVTVEKNGVSASYPFYVFTTSTLSGVESIDAEATTGEAVYYNLQGVRVANPQNGIFVKVVNGKAAKVVL